MAGLAAVKFVVNVVSTIGVRQIITGIVASNVARESFNRKVTVFVAKELISGIAVASIKEYIDRTAEVVSKDYNEKMAAAKSGTA